MNNQGKVAIVTASTKGIGLACVEKLINEGAIVYIAARNEQLTNEIIDSLGFGKQAKFVLFDPLNLEVQKEMIKTVMKNEGHIDILINNYGGGKPAKDKTIFDTDIKDYFSILEMNLTAIFNLTQLVMNEMKINGGSIINISSIGSVVPDIVRISYCTSKAAINALTENIAVHGAKYNIRCNAILPGLIETKSAMEHLPKEFLQLFLNNTPLKKIGQPSDIANLANFLASSDSGYITGELIEVAGGFGKVSPLYSTFNKK